MRGQDRVAVQLALLSGVSDKRQEVGPGPVKDLLLPGVDLVDFLHDSGPLCGKDQEDSSVFLSSYQGDSTFHGSTVHGYTFSRLYRAVFVP